MAFFQIEVRASAEQYDVHAHQIAREILQLPKKHFAPPGGRATDSPPLSIRTAHLYHLSGTLSDSHLEQLIQHLLIDPVIQKACITTIPSEPFTQKEHIVDVFFHPGVTDTLAESILTGAQMLGITGLEHVETGTRYIFDSRFSIADIHAISRMLLYNPVIQAYTLHAGGQKQHGLPAEHRVTASDNHYADPQVTILPLSQLDDTALLDLSASNLLALNLAEMRTIQLYYREQGREPIDVELETLAQTWSEHCSHKTFKACIQYQEVDEHGTVIEEETIHGLLKQYIMHATEQIQPSWLVSAFSDNAGIIRFTASQDIAFKVETHNHPSAIEPFGGANTGVGGVIRDVLGVSAQPLACTDILCFGPTDTEVDELPENVLPPLRIKNGVVNGIRDYGNKMGIPIVNGAVLYDPGYIFNPLVFCGCLGMLPHGSHPSSVEPGDKIVVLGGRTGRDGIHGATFSSGEMSSEVHATAGSAVQIGAPITEKKVADVIIQARDRQLYHAITDCGAGGFSSAIGEMGATGGARVELSHAPLKYRGLAPWEIWLSEAQERMVLAVPPQHLEELLAMCEIEEVEASVLGTFTDDQRLTVTYDNHIVADLDMHFLHHGNPQRMLKALWQRSTSEHTVWTASALTAQEQTINGTLAPTLLALLRHPNICSKEMIIRRYDHEVQGATVLKPLVGHAGNGPGDAAVLQPLVEEDTLQGIVLSNGINPLYGKIDPYHMATCAVDEALRNLTAVGGDITHAALLDNFCWGNPNDPAQLGLLVRAVKGCCEAAIGFKTPFISGKDSLNNEYRTAEKRIPVTPTLLISAVGVIEHVAQTINMSLKTPGNLLYLLGPTFNELAGSHYAEVVDQTSFSQFFPYTQVPHVHIAQAYATMKALGTAIRAGMVLACHDLSEGGLAIAIAEMALASMLGVAVDISQIPVQDEHEVPPGMLNVLRMFSESASRFLVEISPEQLGSFEKHMQANGVRDIIYIGTVTNTTQFIVQDGEKTLINVHVDELQKAWKGEMI